VLKQRLIFHSRFFAIVTITFGLLALACSNLEGDATNNRFDENMKGGLNTYADFNPTDPNNFSFAFVGDTHIGSGGGFQLPSVVSRSKADGDSFLLLGGDMTDTGDDGQYKTFLAVLNSNSFPFYPCIGNHDIFFGHWSTYKAYIGRSIYSFNAGIVHIAVLDTANGQIGEKQLQWLDSDLKASTKPFKIVVMHYPPYVGAIGSIFQLSSEEEAAIFKDMLNQDGANLMLAGHYHGYIDNTIGRARFIVSGGGNTILDSGNAHYLKITVSPSGLDVRKVNL